ncbi:hypothetical protein [Agromyces silvae]|uniref:hypothetical protein n=1 Tax=Agromyces silvae TaxID=3388266 RepID=UPI00280A4FC6|nr:hypothetical protein [Agromyces protaetiae]
MGQITETPARRPGQLSRTALATRSLRAAERLTGDARREALRQHFAEFVTRRRTCEIRQA